MRFKNMMKINKRLMCILVNALVILKYRNNISLFMFITDLSIKPFYEDR